MVTIESRGASAAKNHTGQTESKAVFFLWAGHMIADIYPWFCFKPGGNASLTPLLRLYNIRPGRVINPGGVAEISLGQTLDLFELDIANYSRHHVVRNIESPVEVKSFVLGVGLDVFHIADHRMAIRVKNESDVTEFIPEEAIRGIIYAHPALSGPFCAGDCFTYPYSDIAQRFPRDYYWMYPAMAVLVAYVMVMIAIHRAAGESRKVFTLAGLSFAIMSASILVVDYYIQLFVIQASLVEGETEGIALLTQFNPHGIFIALEEVGYILMSLSFLALVPVFRQYGKTGKWA